MFTPIESSYTSSYNNINNSSYINNNGDHNLHSFYTRYDELLASTLVDSSLVRSIIWQSYPDHVMIAK